MVFLLILIFLAIITYEVPGLVKKQLWRELVAFSVLLAFGMFLSIGQILGYTMPNPVNGLKLVIGSIKQLLIYLV